MTEPVVIRVPAETKAAWKAAAERAGLTLPAYVRLAVEQMDAGGIAAVKQAQTRGLPTRAAAPIGLRSTPENCTRRVRAGSYCRFCGTIHTKGI